MKRKTRTDSSALLTRVRFTFALIAMLCFANGARAQGTTTLTVYEDASSSSQYVPVYGAYADCYQKCEFVIPASELTNMNGGIISKMTFYLSTPASASWSGTFKVFLKTVGNTEISAFSGTDGATIVYQGTLAVIGYTMTINFTKNYYTYTGGNLLIGVYETTTSSLGKSATFIGETVSNASVQGYNSKALGSVNVDQHNFIPKTTFTYSVPVSSVTLSPTAATMVVGGETLTLTATVYPENATDKSLTWASSNENVATVIDGVVTAVATGIATISAEANDGSGKVGTCTVTVNPPTDMTLMDGTPYPVTNDMDVTSATYTKTLAAGRVNLHQPWLVPFDYTITTADLAKFDFYKINMIANSPSPSVEASNDMWVFLTKLSAEAVLHANMPYVYKAKEAVTNYAFTTSPATMKAKNTDILLDTRTTEDIYSFYATYENTTASSSYPFYYVAIDGTICLGNDDNLTVGPYRWIIRKTSKSGETSYARNMHFYDGEGEATAIREDLFAAPSDEAEREVNNGKATNAQWFTLDGRKLNAMPTQSGVYIVRSAAGRLQGKNGKIIIK